MPGISQIHSTPDDGSRNLIDRLTKIQKFYEIVNFIVTVIRVVLYFYVKSLPEGILRRLDYQLIRVFSKTSKTSISSYLKEKSKNKSLPPIKINPFSYTRLFWYTHYQSHIVRNTYINLKNLSKTFITLYGPIKLGED